VLALFPFCGVVALGFAPVAARWGWKRVYIAGYGTRKIVMALLLLLPLVLAHFGHTAGMLFLFCVLIVFALLRALAETASCPWSQEFTPNRVRVKFGGISLVLSTVAAGVAVLIAGRVIGHGTGLSRYLALLAVGCVLGLLGVIMMMKVPGGAPQIKPVDAGAHNTNMLLAMRDRNFAAYLGGNGGMTMGSMMLISFLPLYVKNQMSISSGTVVMLDIAIMIGGALAGLLAGWATDHVGSRPVLMPAAAMTVLVPLGWLLLPRHIPHPVAWCALLYFLYGAASSGLTIAANRLLFNGVIPPEHSTAYTAIFYAWLGVTGGLAPLLAGILLSACGDWHMHIGGVTVDGYSILFLLAFILLVSGWILYGWVRPDDRYTTRGLFRNLPWLNSWRSIPFSQESETR